MNSSLTVPSEMRNDWRSNGIARRATPPGGRRRDHGCYTVELMVTSRANVALSNGPLLNALRQLLQCLGCSQSLCGYEWGCRRSCVFAAWLFGGGDGEPGHRNHYGSNHRHYRPAPAA
jgi:hypothetical protein